MPRMRPPSSLNKFSPMPNTSPKRPAGFSQPTIAATNPNPQPDVTSFDEIQERVAPFYGSKSDTAGMYPKPGIYVSPLTP